MKILLDTHVIIWAITDDPRLPEKIKGLISDPENIIFFSTASLWEIAVKNLKTPDKCPYHEKEIMEYCNQAGYVPLNIQPSHVLGVRNLQIMEGRYIGNYDPFDRILISQAKEEQCIILSHDSAFLNYNEKCILSF